MTLDKIFTSHMVFQRRAPIRVYGEGEGEVTVRLESFSVTARSENGKWFSELPPMEYGGPYTMTVQFPDRAETLSDIYIGEVFLFAGQSNMQFRMETEATPREDYKSVPLLRMFLVDRVFGTDHFTSSGGWNVCEEESVQHWSAIAYLAGREMVLSKDIAVGIILCAQGASIIESWMPEGALEKIGISIPIEQKHLDHTYKDYVSFNSEGILYSKMLSAVAPFSISAVAWYQGESDTSEAEGLKYCDELCELIRIWRSDFKNPSLPFAVVQIADYNPRRDAGWTLIQEAQEKVQAVLPLVRTVISRDVCESNDIHPKTKGGLAKRIAKTLCSYL